MVSLNSSSYGEPIRPKSRFSIVKVHMDRKGKLTTYHDLAEMYFNNSVDKDELQRCFRIWRARAKLLHETDRIYDYEDGKLLMVWPPKEPGKSEGIVMSECHENEKTNEFQGDSTHSVITYEGNKKLAITVKNPEGNSIKRKHHSRGKNPSKLRNLIKSTVFRQTKLAKSRLKLQKERFLNSKIDKTRLQSYDFSLEELIQHQQTRQKYFNTTKNFPRKLNKQIFKTITKDARFKLCE